MNTTKNQAKIKKSEKKTQGFLGPVENLEKHLQTDWWRRIFNSMYLKTDADVVEDINITKNEVNLFTEILELTPEHNILDLACGQGRHSLELARRGFKKVSGIDRSHYLIQKAKTIASTEGLTVNFKEGDARKISYPNDYFDFVMILGNSFGYFENIDDDIRILKEVFRVLKPFGKFLIDVADGSFLKLNFNPRSWEWIDKKHFVCRERSLAGDNERLISREVITNVKKGVIVDQFYAERLYTKASIEELLKNVGFKETTFHCEINTDSQRNQDLGMMERRLIVTSRVMKEWTPPKEKVNGVSKNVVVLLGDPKKPDIIKPDNVFNEDDYHTIDQLKIALSELTDYKFSYVDNHNTFYTELQKIKSKTDFILNLCDEGYGNDAKKELHVPAMLEMLEIPYTGSNPQCLAYCYDKSLVRGIASEMEIPVANAFFIKPEDNLFEFNLNFPVIAKPNYGDGSFGITQKNVANSVEELGDAILWIRQKFGYEKPILVEEFLIGPEISIGIIGNPPDSYTVLPIIEEDFSQLPPELPKISGYEAKWLVDSPYYKLLRSIPASIPKEMEKLLIEYCTKLFERLECRDYCRFDWRLNAYDSPKLLEVNPNPGWCWDGHLAKMANIGGMSYAQMLENILKSAEQRIFVNQLK